jgi:phthiocerol/phenolphthiocerol synthesis type-I polyketide synthase C
LTDAIAIVGASCRFPGADGLEAFWRLLAGGVDAVSEIDDARWSTRFFHHPRRGEPGKSYSWAAGRIDGIDLFDPGFFGISPREAAQIDPQQRLLLELAWHALEDAGIPASGLAGTTAGVYIGASSTDYGDLRIGDPASGDAYFATGATLSILANRISHIFDLRGPSLVVDTACSSSLVALHEACEALRAGRIESALVGGVNLLLSPYPFLGFAQAGLLSRRGRCFAFDARADGYVRGEGGAVVLLKPLERALADDDPIRAIIRGTAVNASGRTQGLSLPSATAQVELLRRVYREAGISADSLAFLEMHGTGTPAGDPVEAASVGEALGRARAAPLPIGSVKTNIGHLEPASGMAGLLKAALALERGVLPASLHCETPNPEIPFSRLNLRLARAAEAIAGKYAGVSSFGFGGTNAHAILAAPPADEDPPTETMPPPLLISARSEAALRALAREWCDTLAATLPERTPSLIRAAARRRDQHQHRLVALGDADAALADFIAGKSSPSAVSGTALREGKLAFVFSGNGAQWRGMGSDAYRHSATFRDAVAEADRALAPLLGWSVAERLAEGLDDEAWHRADIAQPILFAIQTAIVSVLRAMGVAASGCLGHSVGEIPAAWAAGALPLGDAARVVAARSRHQQRTRGTGRMAVLALSEAETAALIAELDPTLDIAAVNSARAVTIAGSAAAIAALGDEAARRGIACRPLDLDFAFHSRAMEAVRDGILADLGDLISMAPAADLVSTVTGGRVAGESLDAEHWWRNVRDTVRFAEAAQAMVSDGYRIFVEIGPSPVLRSYLRDALRDASAEGRVLATLDRRATTGDPFPAITVMLHVAGHDLSGAAPFDGPSDPRGLPLYPWQRERYWFHRTVEATDRVDPIFDHKLLGFRQDGPLPSWLNHLDLDLQPFLGDHRIDGMPVLPAAAIIDMALAAARARNPDAPALELGDVELLRPMGFIAGEAREVRSALVSRDGDWQLTSRPRLADEEAVVHATARLGMAAAGRLLADWKFAGRRFVDADGLYSRAARLGLDYGAAFRTVSRVEIDDRDDAEVTLDPVPVQDIGDYLLHPALLDGALQGLLCLLTQGSSQARLLPRRFGRVRAVAPFGRAPSRARLRVTRRGTRSATADIALYDAADGLIAELADCLFAQVPSRRSDRFLRVDLVPAPLPGLPAPPVFDRIGEIAPALATSSDRDTIGETEQALLLDALVAAVGFAAIHPLVGDEPFTVEELVHSGGLAPNAAPLFGRLLGLLARFGAASFGNASWRLSADHELAEPGELWRTLLAEAPEMVAELALIAAANEDLPRAFREGPRHLDSASPFLRHLREASPSSLVGLAAIRRILDAIANDWPEDRPLRVRVPDGIRLRCSRAVISSDGGGPRDVAVQVNSGRIDIADLTRLGAGLTPGGLLLAVEPMPSPLWDLVGGGAPTPEAWREGLRDAGFVEIGAAPIAFGPWPITALWARTPAASSSVLPASLSLGLIANASAAAFAAALRAQGHLVTMLEPEGEFAGDAMIFVPDAAADPLADLSRIMPLLARAATKAAERKIPLWLVTSGAQQAEETGAGDLVGGALWGFGRVLINEIPGLALRLVDLPPAMTPDRRVRVLAGEIAAAGAQNEIVWTVAGRHVLRLRRGPPPIPAQQDEAVFAACAPPGGLDRLEWNIVPPRAPGPGEIEIEVAAAGLNFRDVMWASGTLPEEALSGGFAGAALGLECAGTVRAIGVRVERIAVGDHVVGFAPQALASRAITRADAVIPIPARVSFAAAATLPVAFVTARYALETLARVAPGEHVLIHAASGGVGLAAIQIAKRRGAIVIATAGSAAKRAFLRLVGADHVCDSRELGFVDAVRVATGGAGVDVVLNSLSGEAMAASLDLLKPLGRFVELGKRDIYENRRLRMRPLRQNISYFAVDIDRLPVERPELAKALLTELSAALAAGDIRPLAHRIFGFADIGDAFRLMQAAGHIGKLVLVPDGHAGVELAAQPNLTLRRDGTYAVTGGIDGFGYRVARWLAEHGAGALALVGRRGAATPGAAERVAELESLGAVVSVHAADVGDRDILAQTLDEIRAAGRPIRGVVHAAATIGGVMIGDIDIDTIELGLRAKLGGAVLLDALTRDDPIELFWLFSSATSFVGAPGQGIYVAANLALEALARRRHAEGRPALAIAWGAIADAGYLADRPDEREALVRRLGASAMLADAALGELPLMAASRLPVVGCGDLSAARSPLPLLATALFEEMNSSGNAVADEALLDHLAGLDGTAARELLAGIIADEAARILRLPQVEIDRHRPLAELGMDSLMGVELRLAIESRLRLDLPLAALTDGASIAALASRVDGLRSRPAATSAATDLAAHHEVPRDPFALGGAAPAED